MRIKPRDNSELRRTVGLQDNTTPLHARVPTHDEDGRSLNDFMMLLPGLRDLPTVQLREKVELMTEILGRCTDVVYVDLNLPLNLLWVSVRQRPGLVLELSASVKAGIPEAVLVGVPPEAMVRRKR